jgi:hypothetical protein
MRHMHYLYETCAIAYGRRALPLFTELPTKTIRGNQKPGFRELLEEPSLLSFTWREG